MTIPAGYPFLKLMIMAFYKGYQHPTTPYRIDSLLMEKVHAWGRKVLQEKKSEKGSVHFVGFQNLPIIMIVCISGTLQRATFLPGSA